MKWVAVFVFVVAMLVTFYAVSNVSQEYIEHQLTLTIPK